jgi:hypothetical protein
MDQGFGRAERKEELLVVSRILRDEVKDIAPCLGWMPDVLPQNSIASLISDLTAGSLNREIVWIFKRASQPFFMS